MSKILVGIPVRHVYGDVSWKTKKCLQAMRASSDHAVEIYMARGQQISQNSFKICAKALEENWDYLLYTGDDIVFPPWALDRLLAHNKDFVSGVCTWKTPPYWVPVGMEGEDGSFRQILITPEHVQNNVLMEVDGVGSGFILVKRTVLEGIHRLLQDEIYPAMPEKFKTFCPLPFFPVCFHPQQGTIGSDFAFAKLAKLAGFKIHMDCGLICRHRWEGEFDITDHWDWLSKHGDVREEELYFGHDVGFKKVDKSKIFWGEGGPPVEVTVTSAGNLYHAQDHVVPILGSFFESLHAKGKPRTNYGYIIGFHVLENAGFDDYINWSRRFDKVVVQWVGSDILAIDSWMNENRLAALNHPRFVHVVEDERLMSEIQSYFGDRAVLPMPTRKAYPVAPLPAQPAVAVYYPKHRHDFHYGDVIKGVIEAMPDVKFHLYHLFGEKPDFDYPNMAWLGQLDDENYPRMLAQSSAMLRLSQHDGRPYSIVEAGIMGRRFVTNFDMPFSERVGDEPTVDEVVKALRKILEETEPAEEIAAFYRKQNDPQVFKERVMGLLTGQLQVPFAYEYESFWNDRYADNPKGGQQRGRSEKQDEVNRRVNAVIRRVVKDTGSLSVLDLGCGSLIRWDQLPVKEAMFKGRDVSLHAIEFARKRYPDADLKAMDVTRSSLPSADVVTALALLQHIKPDDFKPTVNRIFDAARNAVVLVYPTMPTSDNTYQFDVPDVSTWGLSEDWMEQKPDNAPAGVRVFVKAGVNIEA